MVENMSVFAKSFFGAFLGKIVSVAFIAICAALGFGPDKWVEFLISGMPVWFTPEIARYIFLMLASVVFTAFLWGYMFLLFDLLVTRVSHFFSEIEWIDGPHSSHSFGYIISRPHDLALAGHIQLKGKNKSKSSIIVRKAYLRSLVTGEIIGAEIEHIKAEDIEIFSGSNFTVIVKFPNEDGGLTQNSIQGISLQSFLKRFSNFEIVMEADRTTYRVEFNSDETKGWVSLVQTGLMMPAPSEKARVLKRS